MRTSRFTVLPFRHARVLFALIPALAAAQAPDPLPEARRLIEGKDPARAFALLAPLESARAGQPDFDFVLAVAALDAGHLERAVIALERVLVRMPDSDAARLELGRAYLRMGSLDLAAQEFTRLRPRAPDAAARAILDGYLEEIRGARERQRYARSAFVELGAGRDTNISSSTRGFQDAILSSFGLPGIEPTGNSIRRADNFTALNMAADLAYRVAEDRVAFAAAGLRLRRYGEARDYDYRLFDLAAGWQARGGESIYTAIAFVQSFRQDGATAADAPGGDPPANDRDVTGVGLEARRPVAPGWSVALGLQLAGARYADNPGQDTRMVTMSVALEHRPAWWSDGTVVAKVFYGQDEARRPLNEFTDATASRHTHGVRLAAIADPRGRVSWQAAFGWTRRIDDDAYARASLVAGGRDDLWEAGVHAAIKLQAGWSVHPYAGYAYNRSNIPLYTFRKADGGVALRYEYR